MAAFTITGDFDEVSRKLKAFLDANDAKFKAALEAEFKSPSPPPTPAGPHRSAEWSLSKNRSSKRDGADSFSGRVRTSRAPPR